MCITNFLKKGCLKPNYSLRRQLLITYGTTSFLAIITVILVASLTAHSTGKRVKSRARDSLEVQLRNNLGYSTQYAADTISKKFDNLGGAVALIAEATKDRFVGYPHSSGYETDTLVPFYDIESNKNAYPIKMPPLILDWNISSNVDEETYMEHVQERWSWYGKNAQVSTAQSNYRMQGQCDPSVTDPSSKTYFPGCTEMHNDLSTGGVINPTRTNKKIAEKAADLTPILKPLFESHEDVKMFGIYFANSGAGSSLTFPATENDGSFTYVSIGCEWMTQENPFTNRPLATSEEISRCSKVGSVVKAREYNPLERSWCRDQALNPFITQSVGPYLDASSDHLWLLTFGKAIFDSETGVFIGCTLADVSITQIIEIINSVKVGETSNVALLRWDTQGTVVAATQWNQDIATSTTTITDFDLGMGIDASTYEEIQNMVDFSSAWDPYTVKEIFNNKIFDHNGKHISVYPIPTPPEEYNESYRPSYMVIMSIDNDEVFGAVDKMDTAINSDVNRIVFTTLVIGFSGLVLVLLVIFQVSSALTKPLFWMGEVATKIVNNAGGDLSAGIARVGAVSMKWSPKTEVNKLVDEFKIMVRGINDHSAAKIVKVPEEETKNFFQLSEEYRPLYEDAVANSSQEKTTMIPIKKNTGPLLNPTRTNDENLSETSNKNISMSAKSKSLLRSPLFLWIIFLILVPILLTLIAICTVLALDVTNRIPSWLEDVELASVTLERDAILTAAKSRASFSQEVMKQPLRDLHLYSRFAGWLLFGGIERTSSFTKTDTATEECKNFPLNSCPFYRDENRSACDCAWKDRHPGTCRYLPNSRVLQNRFFAGQSLGSNKDTGDRNATEFPEKEYSPETTEWWNNVWDLPGSSQGPAASGYLTTYARVRSLSAMAVAELPLYNYGSGFDTGAHLGTYIGFEADGMLLGYAGCDYSHAEYAHWFSSKDNGAADIRPDICPLNKYGYDCRCRGWYSDGKKKSKNAIENGMLHISPPYKFASSSTFASSATLALVDPDSGTHVAQALLDFLPMPILSKLDKGTKSTMIGQGDGGFPILITPEQDALGFDTVIGPHFVLGKSESGVIGDLVLPHDQDTSANRQSFDLIIDRMKEGDTGTTSFMRKTDLGYEEEIYLAFAPISVQTLLPVYHKSFARGVKVATSLIYTLGIAIPEADLFVPFTKIEDDVSKDIHISVSVLITLIVLTSVICFVMTYIATSSIVRPIITLTEVVQDINNKKIDDDIVSVCGGSQEVSLVYDSFQTLYKVIRFSNAAFFSGDLPKAYRVLKEGNELFHKLNNKRAIGIACNNIGGIMLAIYRQMDSSKKDFLFNLSKKEVIDIGVESFQESLDLGTEAYIESDNDVGNEYEKTKIGKQLANRHFNRGIFLISCQNQVPDYKEKGYANILMAKNLDNEIYNLRIRMEIVQYEVSEFESILARAQGLLSLPQEQAIKDIWDVSELIEKAESILALARIDENSSLFDDITLLGREQQLLSLRIEHLISMGKCEEAAKISIKILVENETLLKSTWKRASNALIIFTGDPNVIQSSGGKNVFFCLDYSGSMYGDRIRRANKNMLKIYEKHCHNKDNIGFVRFNHLIDHEITFNLEPKGINKERHLKIMKGAVDARGGTRFYGAVESIVEKICKSPYCLFDTWIVALTDGMSHDTHDSIKNRLIQWNSNNDSKIHVVIIGFEVSKEVEKICQDMCTVSRESEYIDAQGGLEKMDEAFDQVAIIINGGGLTIESF